MEENSLLLLNTINKYRQHPTEFKSIFQLTSKFISRIKGQERNSKELLNHMNQLDSFPIRSSLSLCEDLSTAARLRLNNIMSIPDSNRRQSFCHLNEDDFYKFSKESLPYNKDVFEIIDNGSIEQIMPRLCISQHDIKHEYIQVLRSEEYNYIGCASVGEDDETYSIVLLSKSKLIPEEIDPEVGFIDDNIIIDNLVVDEEMEKPSAYQYCGVIDNNNKDIDHYIRKDYSISFIKDEDNENENDNCFICTLSKIGIYSMFIFSLIYMGYKK